MKEQRQKKNRLRFGTVAALCAACMLFLTMGMTGWAARTGNVRVDNVNIRSDASTESNRVCKLPINTTVNIIEEVTGSDGNVWYSITFTLDGAEKAGWIRSDMLTVSETEEPEGEISTGGSTSAYTIQEPIESYQGSDALTQTTVTVGDQSYTAWQVNAELTGGQELYLVAAAKGDGSIGWFYYDPAEETFQRDLGQFAAGGEEEPEGLIEALQEELSTLKESSGKQLRTRLYVIIALAALCVILLVIAIIFILKYRNTEYEYYDEEPDGESEEDDEDDEDEEPVRKKRGLFRRREEEEEADDDEDFADFFAAAREKQSQEADAVEEKAIPPSGKKVFATEELPEIDMSAILAVEKEAGKVQQEMQEPVKTETPKTEEESDHLDDFDIEIIDWQDLGL